MARLKELGLCGSLLLLDRWYPSKQFLAYTLESGFSFVMRVRKKWNLDIDAVDRDGWVTLHQDGHTLHIRVIKVVLPGDEIETLLTNLTEDQLPAAEAGELYFKRWGIETASVNGYARGDLYSVEQVFKGKKTRGREYRLSEISGNTGKAGQSGTHLA